MLPTSQPVVHLAASMEANNIQRALTSLEDRFHELRNVGEKRLQANERTIYDLQEQLANAIGCQHETEIKLRATEEELLLRSEEVNYLRIRCEVLLQEAKQVEQLQTQTQKMQAHLEQSKLEDEQLLINLNQTLEDNKKLRIKVEHAGKAYSELRGITQKSQNTIDRLIKLLSQSTAHMGLKRLNILPQAKRRLHKTKHQAQPPTP